MKYELMNEQISYDFAYFNKSMCQMCFQCTISMCEMYELWMN
jgi:hypothetical protein